MMRQHRRLLCASALALLFALASCLALPRPAFAAESDEAEPKVVRVGWYDSIFHRQDQFGRRSGYGYEYQQRIATYTGWTFEYVEGSWPELFQMLQDGELDLLTDVSYTPERAKKVLFSAQPMGSEDYHLFVSPDNTEIDPDDLHTLDGKQVLVNKGSIQAQLFREWAKEFDLSPVIVEASDSLPVLFDAVISGAYDAVVTLDTYGNNSDVVSVCKVGFAESYFGISLDRPDLKAELDKAMERIFAENRDFNQLMTDKYNKAGSISSFLSSEEETWVLGHGEVRVGYWNNYAPFCEEDDKTHLLAGALEDILDYAHASDLSDDLVFSAVSYDDLTDALDALDDGEVDCVFPLSISTYDGEKLGVLVSDPITSAEMYAIVRTADRQGISEDSQMRAAVLAGNPSYQSFIWDNYPKWELVPFEDEEAVLRAVSEGQADCALVSSYRINAVSELCQKYKLSTLATGKSMGLSFAVRRTDVSLYSVLNKAVALMPDAMVSAAISSHSFRSEDVSVAQFVRDHLAAVVASISLVAVVILLLAVRNLRANAKVREGRQIISETERDQLSGLYNWNYFLLYANRRREERPMERMDAVVVNIDRFHSVNDLFGWDFGDRVLRSLGAEVNNIVTGDVGIACRLEADHFYLYAPHREDWHHVLSLFQASLDGVYAAAQLCLRMGVKPWQEDMGVVPQFDRARTACNKVRGDYKNHLVVYDEAMGKREAREQRLLNDLARAVERHELQVYYQPKYRIQGERPMLSSAEALIRWRHPDLGMISPGEFVPLFERSGHVSVLDNYVWAEAARQIATWREAYGVTLPVSVNLSRVDIFDTALSETLDGLVERYGLDVSDLKLEVTESAYTENASQIIQVVNQLRDRGYQIEMDDFGSGFSSLNLLSDMPIDILKMDMAFVRNIERDERDMRMVELILDLARSLQVPVVAEGVETEAQLKLLRDAGCDIVQGYYFSRPLPPDEFEQTILRTAIDTQAIGS